MLTNWTQQLGAFIASQIQNFNAYLEREQRLKAQGQEYDPGAGLALFLFILVWIIGLEFGKHP